jgi:predicted ATPase
MPFASALREAAYDSLPKATRAELHEGLALWLEEHAGNLVERDEIVGYHYEQVFRYHTELGPLDHDAMALASRAAARLLTAGRRRRRGDAAGARALLTRATDLMRPSAERRLSLVSLAEVLVSLGENDHAESTLEQVVTEALVDRDERTVRRAELLRLEIRTQRDRTLTIAAAECEAEDAVAEFDRLGDMEGVASALRLRGYYRAWLGRMADAEAI